MTKMKALMIISFKKIPGICILFPFACCLLLTITSCKHEINNSGVPEAVSASFKKKYPEATDVKWEGMHDQYEVKFTTGGQSKEVLFSPNGTVLIDESKEPINLMK